MTRALSVLGAAGAAALLPLALAAPAGAQAAGAEVRVLHGIPGTPVDVYVNGERALDDFAPGTTTDDLALPAGTYSVAVFPADAADASGQAVIGPVDLTVPASGNVSAIAHLGADGTPTITPFVNDTAAAAAGRAASSSATPPLRRRSTSSPAASPSSAGLTNPNEDTADLPVGTVSARWLQPAPTEPVIGPADVPVTAGQATIVYAIGSLEDSTLDVLVQTVPLAGGDDAPAGVPAGSGGLVDQGGCRRPCCSPRGPASPLALTGGTVLARARRQD
jgi:hypothetical protein